MNHRITAVTQILVVAAMLFIMASQFAVHTERAGSAAMTLTPDQSLIFKNPHEFAWRIFAAINRPAPNDGDRNVEWENWMEETEVYKKDATVPVWHSRAKRNKELHQLLQDTTLNTGASDAAAKSTGALIAGSPILQTSDPRRLSEVRINNIAFKDIVDQKIWYKQGQLDAFNNVTQKPVVFHSGAREIKARWKVLDETKENREDYHWQKATLRIDDVCQEKTLGLIALAITTKDLPNWFWATWEHVDNDHRCEQLPCNDPFGSWPPITQGKSEGEPTEELIQLLKMNGLGNEWKHYRLVGVQTDFTDPTGLPVKLGNSILEGAFLPESSCMTCHVRSAINAQGTFLQKDLAVTGAPDKNWFYTFPNQLPNRIYMTFDFVWSVAKASNLTQPPGQRCP